MPLYDHLHYQFSKDFGVYAPAVAGMTARAVAVLATAPLELLRTRKQASEAGAAGSRSSAWQWLTSSHQAGYNSGSTPCRSSSSSRQCQPSGVIPKVTGMWTGVGATLARDVPFTALYWCAVEPIRAHLLSQSTTSTAWPEPLSSTRSSSTSMAVEPQDLVYSISSSGYALEGAAEGGPPAQAAASASQTDAQQPPSTSQVIWANLVAGSISGSLAAAATTPFDVAKTRLQTAAPSQATHRGIHQVHAGRCLAAKQPGTLETLQGIWKTQGMRGLFTGVGPRVARSAPACAIVIATYEVLKTSL
jgi:solute carrier family 25 protein 39/40